METVEIDDDESFAPLDLDSMLEVSLVEDNAPAPPVSDLVSSTAVETSNENDSSKTVEVADATKSISVNGNVESSESASTAKLAWGMDEEEDIFYKDLFENVEFVRFLRLHCTMCDTHLGCRPGTILMKHVRLGVLVCQSCYRFYVSGEIPVGEDGSEVYCCWCGQGGNVICCSSCTAVFCKKCIKRNYAANVLKEIEASSEWLCFLCNYRSLWEHRAVCRAAITYESSNKPTKNKTSSDPAPGINQEFCCSADNPRRTHRLRSSMPSAITFQTLIRDGLVRSSVAKLKLEICKGGNEPYTDSSFPPSEGAVNVNNILAGALLKHNGTEGYDSSRSNSLVNSPPIVIHPNPPGSSTPVRPLSAILQHRPPQPNPGPSYSLPNNGQPTPRPRVVLMPPLHIPATSTVRFAPGRTLFPLGTTRSENSPPLRLPTLIAGNVNGNVNSSPAVPRQQQQLLRLSGNKGPLVLVDDVPVVSQQNRNILLTQGGTVRERISSPSQSVPGTRRVFINTVIQHNNLNNSDGNLHGPSLNDSHSVPVNLNFAVCGESVNKETSQFVPVSDHIYARRDLPAETVTSSLIPQNTSNRVHNRAEHRTPQNKHSRIYQKTPKGYVRVRSPDALLSVGISDISHPEETAKKTGAGNETLDSLISNSLLPKTNTNSVEPNEEFGAIFSKSLVADKDCSSVSSTLMCESNVPNHEKTSESADERVTDLKWLQTSLRDAEDIAKVVLTRAAWLQEALDISAGKTALCTNVIEQYGKLLKTATERFRTLQSDFSSNTENWQKCFPPDCGKDIAKAPKELVSSSSSFDGAKSVEPAAKHAIKRPHIEKNDDGASNETNNTSSAHPFTDDDTEQTAEPPAKRTRKSKNKASNKTMNTDNGPSAVDDDDDDDAVQIISEVIRTETPQSKRRKHSRRVSEESSSWTSDGVIAGKPKNNFISSEGKQNSDHNVSVKKPALKDLKVVLERLPSNWKDLKTFGSGVTDKNSIKERISSRRSGTRAEKMSKLAVSADSM